MAVGHGGAAVLYEAFLRDTIRTCAQVGSETVISFADDAPSAEQFFERFAPSLARVPQPDADFGGRLASAMHAGFETGCVRVAIIGSDIPHIGPTWIAQAFDRLDEADVVLGPTFDGGYYLIAMRAPEPALFEAIDWSSGREFGQAMDRTVALGLSVALIEITFDIDDIRDLEALRELIATRGPGSCPATAEAMSQVDGAIGPALKVRSR